MSGEAAVSTFGVLTVHGDSLRLTCWHLGDGGPELWLHVYDSPDGPPHDPNGEGFEFFSGIALDAEAAANLGTALLLAAERLS